MSKTQIAMQIEKGKEIMRGLINWSYHRVCRPPIRPQKEDRQNQPDGGTLDSLA